MKWSIRHQSISTVVKIVVNDLDIDDSLNTSYQIMRQEFKNGLVKVLFG